MVRTSCHSHHPRKHRLCSPHGDGWQTFVNQIANAVSISRERVQNILHNELGMLKVSARWVPRLLTPDQNHTRLVMSQANLAFFEADPANFLERFFTQEECWVHHFKAETKRQSMQWKHSSSPPPKKANVVSSAGKVMASIFWDAKGIMFIDYLQKGQTINVEYCANLLRQLRKVGSPVSPGQCTQVCGCNACCAWLWHWPGWSPSILSWFGTIWIFSVPQHEKTQYWTDDEFISAVEDFSRIRMRVSIPRESKRCNIDIEEDLIDRKGDYVEK